MRKAYDAGRQRSAIRFEKKGCMGFPHGVVCSLLHFISKQLKVEVEENVFNSGFVSSEIA